jgi:aspartate aminotransferase
MSIGSHLPPLRASVPFLDWYAASRHAARVGDPNIADLVFGNPHEMPLPQYVAALARQVEPRNKDWFAYKMSEPVATRTVAASLRARMGLDFSPDDVFMTNGGFAAIAACLRAVAGPGDEVIFLSPPWFFYELLVRAVGATPVRVHLVAPAFALDEHAIARAITPRTRALIVNSPHNPTGRINDEHELTRLSGMLTDASAHNGHPIALLSDEAYWKIVFDGRSVPSPAQYYPHTFVLYSYGKQLLAPGQRIGYIALPPTMPDRAALREAIMVAQCATGFAFPNALLQHALPEIEPLCVDLGALQRRRDRVVTALRDMGYETLRPAATFYVLARSPLADDLAFVDRLAELDTFVLPGALVEVPGWFRISLTANDAMIERALHAFDAAKKAPLRAPSPAASDHPLSNAFALPGSGHSMASDPMLGAHVAHSGTSVASAKVIDAQVAHPRALAPPSGDLALVSTEIVDAAIKRSRSSPRRRVIQPFHKTEADPLHRMLNAVQPESYIRPHRHLDPPKAEAFILLRGAIAFFTFENDGRVRDCLRLAAGSERFGVDLGPGVYHSFIALVADTVIYEVKTGPYSPTTDKAFAPFAPEEDDPEAAAYMTALLAELARREHVAV